MMRIPPETLTPEVVNICSYPESAFLSERLTQMRIPGILLAGGPAYDWETWKINSG